MARSLRNILLLVLIASAGACSQPAPLIDGPARPPMWEVSGGDTGRNAGGGKASVIILGSIHALPPGVEWQGAEVRIATARADALWLELAPGQTAAAPALFAQMARDERVPPLRQRFNDRTATAIADLAADAGVDEDDANRTESWALMLAIGTVVERDAGFSAANGVEAQLTRAFADAGKPVRGLESARGQLSILDDMPPAMQDRMLRLALTDQAQAPARLSAITTAWARGDEPALTTLAREALAPTPELAEPLLLARNRAWADVVAARIEQRSGTILLAVGTAHLVGDGSLIALLRARGYTVRRLQ